MKYLILLGMISLLLACSSNEKSVHETVSMEELMGEVEALEVVTQEDVIETVSVRVSDGTALSNLMVSLQADYDTLSLSIPHKIDRYGYNSRKKVRFLSKLNELDSHADVYQYNFSDSLKLNNAFYNWLDCFGDNCTEIKLGKDVIKIQTSPSYTLIYDTILVSINYNLVDKNVDFKSFQDSIISQFGSEYRYAIQTDTKGNLKWK